MLLVVHRANVSWRPHLLTTRRYVRRLGLLQHHPSSWDRDLADRIADADTANVQECVTAARALAAREPVDGVLAFAEYAVSAAAAVAADLGLPGVGPRVATLARDKFLMRQAFAAGGVPCPRFALASGLDDALRVAAEFGYPVVVKPVLGSGSQFVRRIDDPSGMAEHFPWLRAVAWDAFSLDPLRDSRAAYGDGLLIESYIDGGEVSVESVVVRGQTEVLAIHDKPLPMTGPLFEEILYTTPSRLPADTQQRLRECVGLAHAALGIATGVTHAEFRVTPDGMPVALEVAARIGGGAVYQSVRHSVGIDMVEVAIDLARGQRPVLTRHDPRPVGDLDLFAEQDGVLESVCGVDEAAADPAVLEVQLYHQPGDQILTMPLVQQPHGHIVFTAAAAAELDQTAKRLGDLVRFRVRSPAAIPTDETAHSRGFRLIEESSPAGSQFEVFDTLRSEFPSFRADDRQGFWVLTEHETISAALRDHEVFTSESVFVGNPSVQRKFPPLMVDPPQHTLWRQRLSPLFSPRAIEGYRELMANRCAELISGLADRESCDFVADFSNLYPTYVFLSLMGIPVQDLDQLMGWQADIDRPPDSPEASHRTAHAVLSLAIYLSAVIRERKAEPRDDVISQILGWEFDGRPISEEEAAELCMMLCIAGLATVASELSYIFWHLATHEEDRNRVVSSPELIPGAIEEFLRLYPVAVTGRKLARDSRLGGCLMRAGDMVMLPPAAANRDPTVFVDPARFLPGRTGANHLAFGAGVHYCLGASLARAELRIALEQWHKSIPDYHLVPGTAVAEYRSQVFWIKSLPLTWP